MRIVLALCFSIALPIALHGQSFYAAAVSILPSTRPEPTPETFVATPISKGNIWSISGNSYSLTHEVHPRFQSTAWTAVATPAQTVIGALKLFVLAGSGAATAGTNVGYSVLGGTVAAYTLGKGPWVFIGGYFVEKTSIGGTDTRGVAGIGRAF